MMFIALASASFIVPTPRAPSRRPAEMRHQPPVARVLAFVGKAEVCSPPFAESGDVSAWFAEESAMKVLMSQADSSERLDTGDVEGEQRWEVTTGIPFPGMVAKSATPMNVKINKATSMLRELSLAAGRATTHRSRGAPGRARG